MCDNNLVKQKAGFRLGKKIMKYCPECKKTKSGLEFYKDKFRRDGLSTRCKPCTIAYVKAYTQTERGREVARKAQRKYRASDHGKKRKREDQKAYLATERGKEIKHKSAYKYPERRKARIILGNSIRDGKLKPAREFQCSNCNNSAKEYHHHNGYAPEHALDVIPLCRECHGQTNRIY